MTCVPQQGQAVRIPEENAWDTEGEGKLASYTSLEKEKVAGVPHLWGSGSRNLFLLK